jgi:hypothetical protein
MPCTLGRMPSALGGNWDLGFAVGVGMGKESFWRSLLAAIAGVSKNFMFLTLSLGTGMGDRCCLASRVIVKVTTGQ